MKIKYIKLGILGIIIIEALIILFFSNEKPIEKETFAYKYEKNNSISLDKFMDKYYNDKELAINKVQKLSNSYNVDIEIQGSKELLQRKCSQIEHNIAEFNIIFKDGGYIGKFVLNLSSNSDKI